MPSTVSVTPLAICKISLDVGCRRSDVGCCTASGFRSPLCQCRLLQATAYRIIVYPTTTALVTCKPLLQDAIYSFMNTYITCFCNSLPNQFSFGLFICCFKDSGKVDDRGDTGVPCRQVFQIRSRLLFQTLASGCFHILPRYRMRHRSRFDPVANQESRCKCS